MAAQHTPGPWIALPEEADKPYTRVRGTRLGCRYKVANVLAPSDHEYEVAETRLNARLIAAAPELLAALQWHEQFKARDEDAYGSSFERVAEAFHRDTGFLMPGKDCRVHSPEVRQAEWEKWIAEGIARTRAAIAKATGSAA